MKKRFSLLLERHPALHPCQNDLNAALDLLVTAYRNRKKLLVCGNGGSAADSEHLVAELMKGFLKTRPIASSVSAKLEAAAEGQGKKVALRLQGALPAICLASPISLVSAIGNDIDFEMVFAQQVYGLGQLGDVLLGISTSGNSMNVANAVIVAKALGLGTIALTGQSGGRLAPLADIAIKVPSDDIPEIQELHLPVYHWLSTELEEIFFPS